MVPYLRGLLSETDRRNGWTLARPPVTTVRHTQCLLNHYLWNADAPRDDIRDFVVEHIGDPERGILILDEMGSRRRASGRRVWPRYSGTARRIKNYQFAVFLTYRSEKGTCPDHSRAVSPAGLNIGP
jgi:SRSO17 transposase